MQTKYDEFNRTIPEAVEGTAKIREETVALHDSQMATLNGELGTEQRRSARLKTQAEKFTAAVTGCHKLTMDAINSQAIDDADQGE